MRRPIRFSAGMKNRERLSASLLPGSQWKSNSGRREFVMEIAPFCVLALDR
jgi:hypothetical protein